MCDTDEFGKYISKTRMSNYLSLEQLSEGICDSSSLNRIEHGKRYANKLTRDRVLGRLGIDGCEFPYKSRVMGTSEPLKPLKAPYMARNPVKWGFFRLKGQEIPLKI